MLEMKYLSFGESVCVYIYVYWFWNKQKVLNQLLGPRFPEKGTWFTFILYKILLMFSL